MKKVVYYRGIKFTKFDSSEYYENSRYGYLHRFVWLCERGEIPKGCQIHHIDENKENNDISNLMLVTVSQHRHLHNPPQFSEVSKQILRDSINRNRDKLNEYHSSEQGRRQKSETAKQCWIDGKMKKPTEYVCEVCGKSYTKYSRSAEHRFCSWQCRVLFENPEQELVCPICGKTFIKPAGKIGVTCSKSCSVKLNHKNRNKY